MKLSLLFLSLLFFSLITLTKSCKSSHTFEKSSDSCTFEVIYLDDYCNKFDFNRCAWKQCAQWKSINNEKTCIRHKMQNNKDWDKCLSKCCEDYVSIADCQDSFLNNLKRSKVLTQSKIMDILFIILSILVGSVCVIVCDDFRKLSYCIRRICQHFRKLSQCIRRICQRFRLPLTKQRRVQMQQQGTDIVSNQSLAPEQL